MSVALVFGGADCLQEDFANATAMGLRYDAIIACNDAIAVPQVLLAAVTLHPENLQRWLNSREANGFPPPALMFTHKVTKRHHVKGVSVTDYNFPGQTESMTSGVMAAKVALIDLKFDKVVFCGVPMTKVPHFFGGPIWDIADHYFKRWYMVAPEFQKRMRSMSGRTQALLGPPSKEWTHEDPNLEVERPDRQQGRAHLFS